jgi:signal transduction histidine kinase
MRLSPAKIVGAWLPSVLDSNNREVVERACERVASTRRPYTFDIDEPAIGGTVSISISPLRIPEGDFFIHTIRDITDQRHMQERLAQASRMASIGRLATGVAHEINTPLATITGCAQSLSRQLASLPEITDQAKWSMVNERLNTIVEQSFRCKKITRDLLDYAKPNKPSFVVCDLSRVASEAIETAARDRESERIVFRVTGQPWQATTDPDLVRQILINLIVNAVDASEEKSRVWIETRFLKRLAKISVRDRGKGIAANELERIFDPFYTTKSPGKGTGLGLSISQSLAMSLGGRLEVASEPGRGSRFTLTLPREPQRRARS